MGTEDMFRKNRERREKRVSKEYELRNAQWLVVCEGKKTEPNYFEQLIKYINCKLPPEKKISCVVEGTGKNTESLVKTVDDFFNLTDKIVSTRKIRYAKTFVVFDKDSFSKQQFNNAIHIAESKGYIPLWSNECFELWYLLHFCYWQSNLSREEYFQRLSDIQNMRYEKSDNHFPMLDTEKNLKCAMRNAKKLYEFFKKDNSCAKKAPCTMIFKFIEEVENEIGIKIY